MRIKATSGKRIHLGYAGEHKGRRVYFDVSSWVNAFPDEPTTWIVVHAPADAEPYSTTISCEDGYAVWSLGRDDLANVGSGHCQLMAIMADRILKSEVYTTVVDESLESEYESDGGETPAWIQQFVEVEATLTELKDQTVAAANRAEAVKTSIEASGQTVEALNQIKMEFKQSLVDLGTASETALGELSDAVTTANQVEERMNTVSGDLQAYVDAAAASASDAARSAQEAASAAGGDFALTNHDHDTVYSKLSHTHGEYSDVNHNHDDVYSKLSHVHSDYAALVHSHDDVYSKSGHTHANYLTANDISGFKNETEIRAIISEMLGTEVAAIASVVGGV